MFLPDPLDQRSYRDSVHITKPVQRSLFSLTALQEEIQLVERDFSRLTEQIGKQAQQKLSTSLASLRESAQKYAHDFVQTNKSEEISQDHSKGTESKESPRQVARSVVANVLYSSSDAQTLAGWSFLSLPTDYVPF